MSNVNKDVCSGVFIANVEQGLHIVLVFPFLTLNK